MRFSSPRSNSDHSSSLKTPERVRPAKKNSDSDQNKYTTPTSKPSVIKKQKLRVPPQQ